MKLPRLFPLLLFGVFLFCSGKSFGSSDSTITRLLNELQHEPEDTNKVYILNEIAFSYTDKSGIDLDKARYYLEKCKSLAEKINFNAGLASMYNTAAIVEKIDGNYERAIEHFQEAIRLFNLVNKKVNIAITLRNMARLYKVQLDNNEMAFKYREEAHEIYKELNDTLGMIKTYSELGFMYAINFDDKVTAKTYFDTAFELARLGGHDSQIAIMSSDYASILDPNVHLEKIHELIYTSIRYYEEVGDEIEVAKLYFSLGYYSYVGGEAEEALELTEKARVIYESQGRIGLILNAEEALHIIHYELGNYQQAYHHLNSYDSLRHVLLNETTQKNISELEIKYETEKKEQENIILKRDNEIEKQKATLNQRMFWGILIFSVLLFLSLLLWFLKYRQKRQSLEREKALQMEQLNQQIDILQASVNSRTEEPKMVTPPKIPLDKINHLLSSPLSEREFEVLNELAKGFTNQQIADNLFVSINTVKTHLLKIYAKLDVKNRVQAVKKISVG